MKVIFCERQAFIHPFACDGQMKNSASHDDHGEAACDDKGEDDPGKVPSCQCVDCANEVSAQSYVE